MDQEIVSVRARFGPLIEGIDYDNIEILYPTCSTCKHYRDDDPNNPLTNAKMCKCPKIIHSSRSNNWPDSDRDTLVPIKSDSVLDDDCAGVVDGSGYMAHFYPMPSFGCVHHEHQ